MRYPASEKFEIIRLVEESALPVRRTLEKIGIPHATFYRWYDLYQTGGPEALADRRPKPDRVWNRIPDDVRERIIRLALDQPALSPRELAVRFTDTEGYFVSEVSGRRTSLISRSSGGDGVGGRGVRRSIFSAQEQRTERLYSDAREKVRSDDRTPFGGQG